MLQISLTWSPSLILVYHCQNGHYHQVLRFSYLLNHTLVSMTMKLCRFLCGWCFRILSDARWSHNIWRYLLCFQGFSFHSQCCVISFILLIDKWMYFDFWFLTSIDEKKGLSTLAFPAEHLGNKNTYKNSPVFFHGRQINQGVKHRVTHGYPYCNTLHWGTERMAIHITPNKDKNQ